MSEFDVVVVGAGAAGLCCAGELVLAGRRPLLISETAEVGHTFRSVWMDERNRGSVQALAWQVGWGGGWWLPLARRLDLPVSFRDYNPMEMTVIGSGERVPLPYMGTAAAIVDTLSNLRPLSPEAREQMLGALTVDLAMSPEEVFALDRVRYSDRLRSLGAGDEVVAFLTAFCGSPNGLSASDALEHLSVACALWTLRIMFVHEGVLCEMNPDPCEGVWIPIATEVERRGGRVWRKRKVQRVLVEDGRAVGVVMRDGVEVRADAVALATSNGRLAMLLDPVPVEVQATLDYVGPAPQRQLVVFILLNRPLLDRPVSLSMSWPDGRRLGAVVDAHHSNVEPGKQLVHLIVTNIGDRTEDDVLREVEDGMSQVFPEYRQSVEKVKTISHTSEHWMDYTTIAPKLPRQSQTIDGLWYVGQGAAPISGIWTEAAAGSGILGARAILAAPAVST